jgi:outer membrane lipoprotein-sorting protein
MNLISMFIVFTKCQYCKFFFVTLSFLFYWANANAQTAEEILQKIKTKLGKINDYEAEGKMKTNVAFIKAPVATVKVFYKSRIRSSF